MIKTFEYEALDSGWKLEKASFSELNLLVGPSGAGKTRILRALQEVQKAGLSGLFNVESAQWEIELRLGGQLWTWSATTKVDRVDLTPMSEPALFNGNRFLREKIAVDGEILVERDPSGLTFGGQKLPRLEEAMGTLRLLKSEARLVPLVNSLSRWTTFESEVEMGGFTNIESADSLAEEIGPGLESLRSRVALHSYKKLFALQKFHQSELNKILSDFQECFPTVEDLKIDTFSNFGAKPRSSDFYDDRVLVVGLREKGVKEWILSNRFASGMAKTLKALIEIHLMLPGSVLLVDEVENSLGVNCLPVVAEALLNLSAQAQVILTSHHPYVINKIPVSAWQVVTRKGSTVKVVPSSGIKTLQTASSLEKFIELINLPEYERGIA